MNKIYFCNIIIVFSISQRSRRTFCSNICNSVLLYKPSKIDQKYYVNHVNFVQFWQFSNFAFIDFSSKAYVIVFMRFTHNFRVQTIRSILELCAICFRQNAQKAAIWNPQKIDENPYIHHDESDEFHNFENWNSESSSIR